MSEQSSPHFALITIEPSIPGAKLPLLVAEITNPAMFDGELMDLLDDEKGRQIAVQLGQKPTFPFHLLHKAIMGLVYTGNPHVQSEFRELINSQTKETLELYLVKI